MTAQQAVIQVNMVSATPMEPIMLPHRGAMPAAMEDIRPISLIASAQPSIIRTAAITAPVTLMKTTAGGMLRMGAGTTQWRIMRQDMKAGDMAQAMPVITQTSLPV